PKPPRTRPAATCHPPERSLRRCSWCRSRGRASDRYGAAGAAASTSSPATKLPKVGRRHDVAIVSPGSATGPYREPRLRERAAGAMRLRETPGEVPASDRADTLGRSLEDVQSVLDSTTEILHSVLDSTADGILVVDQRGKIVTYNRRFADMWLLPEHVL